MGKEVYIPIGSVRRGTNPQCEEFKKTFVIGQRASIRQIIIEAPKLAPTMRTLRKNTHLNHLVEPYFDEQGRRDEYITRIK